MNRFIQIIALLLFTASLTITTQAAVKSNPYASQQAQLRTDAHVCAQEQQFLQTRLPIVKANLEQLLATNLDDNQVPQIAVCCGSGGYRAALATLGWVQGFTLPPAKKSSLLSSALVQQVLGYAFSFINAIMPAANQDVTEISANTNLGLLDICTYAAGLSGSAWSLAGLIESRQSVDVYAQEFMQTITNDLYQNVDSEEIALVLLEKYSLDQPLSLMDIYGALLAQKVLLNVNGHPNRVTLDSQQICIEAGNAPLPIYTAVIAQNEQPYPWIEFTPYEVGSAQLNAHIPTWAFGRTFNQGLSQDFNPPQSLGFGLGIWGSSMTADLKDFYTLVLQPMTGTVVNMVVEQLLTTSNQNAQQILDYRVSPATVHNWMFNSTIQQFSQDSELVLVDAGMDFSLPTVPLLTRPVDIIIILDPSHDVTIGLELQRAIAYAQAHNLKFPPINFAIIDQPCSVHSDPNDSTVPVVIYLPLVKNAGYQNGWDPRQGSYSYLAAYAFQYSLELSQQLFGLTNYTMQQSQTMIVDAIQQWVAQRQ